MANSTRKPKSAKPAKPYRDFPLFAHATKRWAKKINGKLCYFGAWNDPDAALQKYLDQKDDLYAGRTPRTQKDGFIVKELLNRFLTSKQRLLYTGEIANRTFLDYHRTCEHVKLSFGLTRLVSDLASDDFEAFRAELAKTRGPVALGNEIQRVRVVFKYAYDAGLIDRPVRYGPVFKRPSKKVLRIARNTKGPRMFEAEQIREMIKNASVTMKAMVFLGINAGFGNADVGRLPQSAIDLKGEWVTFPRPKTGIERRCPLWPKTVAALMIVLNEDHLRRVLAEYFEYYNVHRAHQGLDGDTPCGRNKEPPDLEPVRSIPFLGGLHHRYTRQAA